MVCLAGAAMVLGAVGVAQAGHRVVTMSKYNFHETVSTLKAAIEAEGMKVLSVIDHQALLQEAGTPWRGWVVIEFISPKYAKEVLGTEASADLDLPLRISVMDGDPKDAHGKEPHASYYKPSGVWVDAKKLTTVGKELDHLLAKIVGLVAAKGKGH